MLTKWLLCTIHSEEGAVIVFFSGMEIEAQRG